MWMCVCRQKTRLFTVLPLENRHKITLYRGSAIHILLKMPHKFKVSRVSLLSSVMAMVSDSCAADKNITLCLSWVCHDEPERAYIEGVATTSMRKHCMSLS